ncbi:hypothetical protein SeMB42_g04864 [Synchytrium endobioticum]|uniref:Methyltransferase type 11 domain-containing protein n=1 Tax=Synchytrium endobioticum TaxID=286115 RepID=A0A507CVN1_9FUNG|nr:hypothetical protein SeLEV6574_g05570 [Synchytrium endobioticum]TPX43091.1 hypothetical protein SeMB42_g04864 [Synchytrium endobioticum]
MASFSDENFDSASYRDHRPRYGDVLYNIIYEYHSLDPEAKFETAVDLATGTGQAAIDLAQKFNNVKAFDISATMLKSAMAHPKVTYAEGRDTHIPIADSSVDVLTVAEAAHYFDFDRFLTEANRVLKPGGTLAFWGYFNFEIEGHAEICKLINDFSVDFLDEYFDPRRHRLDNWYADYSLDAFFSSSKRTMLPHNAVEKSMTIRTLLEYPKTWSGYQTYRTVCRDQPDEWERIKQNVLDVLGGGSEEVLGQVVDVKWPTVLVMGRKQ